MKWLHKKTPDTLPDNDLVPVYRYHILVTYPEGGNFALNIYGPEPYSDPKGHDPIKLSECIVDGLRRGGYDVSLQEERFITKEL